MADQLPFSQPGRQLTGEGDASELAPDAKRLMYFVKLIAGSAGVPVYQLHRELANGGTVTAQTAGGIERITMHMPGKKPPAAAPVGTLSRLVWLPEGFVITPRTAAATNGFGMPLKADGQGTPGGPLTQAIVNRFTHNQYPDAVYRVAGGIENAATRILCAAPLFFMPWELTGAFGIGVIKNGKLLPQFKDHWTVNYTEKESATWHCHRPMPSPRADDLVHKTMRTATNLLRAEVNLVPVNAPLRGAENVLAETILYLSEESGLFGHDSTLFKAGYQDFSDRMSLRCGIMGPLEVGKPGAKGGENVYLTTALDIMTPRYGKAAVADWRNSPGHYANMITDWAETKTFYPVMESATRDNKGHLISKQQEPPYSVGGPVSDLVPPVNGSEASENFYGLQNWVVPSNNTQEVSDAIGITGLYGTQGHAYFPRSYMLYITSGPSMIRFKGRSIEVHDNVAAKFTALAARIIRPAPGVVKLRVAGHQRVADVGGTHSIVVYEGLAHDFKKTRVEVARFNLPDDVGQISFPKFSAAGKLVFSYTVASAEYQVLKAKRLMFPIDVGDAHGRGPMVTTAGTDADAVWGETIHFVQLTTTTFSEIRTSSLDMVVEWWNESTYANDTTSDIIPGRFGVRRTCIGEYAILADYKDETVVYATAVVNTTLRQSVETAYGEEVMLRGHLRFPDGTETAYTYTDTATDYSVSGFFNHFLYLDILNPKRSVVMRYDVSGGVRPFAMMSLITGGETVRRKTEVLPAMDDPFWFYRDQVFNPLYPTHNAFIDACPHRPETTFYSAVPEYRSFIRFNPAMTYATAGVTHKASLVTAASFSLAVQFRGSDVFTQFDGVGPSFIIGSPTSPAPAIAANPVLSYASSAFYRDEWLYAGKVDNTICLASDFNGNFYAGNGWTDDAGYFWRSSLDLKAITGIADLADNILPIGTL